jgi:mono/diheme cytochrome c family protein
MILKYSSYFNYAALAVFYIAFVSGFAKAETETNKAMDGEKLYNLRCAACHSLNPPPTLAPPVRGLIRHYTDEHQSKKEVIKAIINFAKNPSEDHMVFPEMAKDRFGNMPPIPFDEKELKVIAAWMWDKVQEIRSGRCQNCGHGSRLRRGSGRCLNGEGNSTDADSAQPTPQDAQSSETYQKE